MPTRPEFGFDHLAGNANVSRNVNPRIIGRVRRSDPDGFSAVTYFPSLSGKTLDITYTEASTASVTANVTFAADGMQAAIDQINALDPTNLEAQDVDGFLALRNKNGGGNHYIQLDSGTAAAVLGLEVYPYPGYRSVAGEIASAPVNRQQKNPVGTALLSKDETLSSDSINRGLLGIADTIYRFIREQDREVTGFGQVDITGANLFTLAGFVAIRFPTPVEGMRIPLLAFPDATFPSQPGVGKLSSMFRLQTVNGDEVVLSNKQVPRITRVLWGAGSVGSVNDTQAFSTYSPLPTPVAFSVFGSNPSGIVTKVVKLPAVSISEISGNVVKCSGTPNFVTNHIKAGDTARITGSTQTSPFSHNGEFIVDEVLSENVLRLRPKSKYEIFADPDSEMPAGLNQGTTGMGSVEILVGEFLNGPGLIFHTDVPAAFSSELQNKVFKFGTGVRFKSMPVSSLARSSLGGIGDLLAKLAATIAPDGASFIGGQVTSDLPVGTLRSQIDALATGWAKLDRANTFTKPQTVRGDTGDSSPALATDGAPFERKHLWSLNNGSEPIVGLYWYCSSGNGAAGFEIVTNAVWDDVGSTWTPSPGREFENATRLFLNNQGMEFGIHRGDAGDLTWLDSDFKFELQLNPFVYGAIFGNNGVQIGDDQMDPGTSKIRADRSIVFDDGTQTNPIRTLLYENQAGIPVWTGGTARAKLRMYIVGAGLSGGPGFGNGDGVSLVDSFEIVIGAAWSGTHWQQDDQFADPILMRLDPLDGLLIMKRRPGVSWSGYNSTIFEDRLIAETVDQSVPGDTGWNAMINVHPHFSSGGFGTGMFGSFFDRHGITSKSIPKAWASILYIANQVDDGYGIASVDYSSTNIRVWWTNSFDTTSGNYIVLTTIGGASGGGEFIVKANCSNPDYVDLTAYDSTDGSVADFDSVGYFHIHLAAFGNAGSF